MSPEPQTAERFLPNSRKSFPQKPNTEKDFLQEKQGNVRKKQEKRDAHFRALLLGNFNYTIKKNSTFQSRVFFAHAKYIALKLIFVYNKLTDK